MSTAHPTKPSSPRGASDPRPFDPKDSPSARTTSFWDKIADQYAQKPVANPDAYQRKLGVLKRRLHAEHRVLDIGCGTGSLALEMAPLVSEVEAIDLSTQMIRIAERKAADAHCENTRFHVSSIERLVAFKPSSFDVVSAFNLLHLVDDLDDSLAKVFDLLAPGGTFVASTPCLKEGRMPYGLILPVMRLLGRAPHVLPLRAAQVLDGMHGAGFVDVERIRVNDDPASVFTVATKPIDAA